MSWRNSTLAALGLLLTGTGCEYAIGIDDFEAEPEDHPDSSGGAAPKAGSSSKAGSGPTAGAGGSSGASQAASPASTPSTDVCAPAPGDTACDTCAQSSCCVELRAFSSAPNAGAFVACIEPCSTDACLDRCVNLYPGAATPFVLALGCLEQNCSIQCS